MQHIAKKNRRKVWTNSETRLFLSCYKARKDEFCEGRGKIRGYAQVLQDMISQGLKDTSLVPLSLESKMRTLLHTYKIAKDSARQTGKPCKAPFMKELDDIFNEKSVEQNESKETFKEKLHIKSDKGMRRTTTCRLCIQNCNEYKCIFDDTTGRANPIYSTIIKYFDPMDLNLTQEYPHQEIAICLKCWSRICEIDTFKHSVLNAQNTIRKIKPKTDDGKKLERYFGKQDGDDGSGVCVSVKNEAHNRVDESQEMNYSGDDMANGDVVHDDAIISDGETDQYIVEQEESIHSSDKNKYVVDYITLSELELIEQPRAKQKKSSTKFKSNKKNKAKASRGGKLVKRISKYRQPDYKEVALDASIKHDYSWSSNANGDKGKNVSHCKYSADMDFEEYITDSDSPDTSSTSHPIKPEFGCNACGKSASSPEALRDHVCSALRNKFKYKTDELLSELLSRLTDDLATNG